MYYNLFLKCIIVHLVYTNRVIRLFLCAVEVRFCKRPAKFYESINVGAGWLAGYAVVTCTIAIRRIKAKGFLFTSKQLKINFQKVAFVIHCSLVH
ncbi:hypothetical protein L6452_09386 [Arctium lappa]|uniref:Uncharacterized protein n=1 Tax=Arctium lappa TaxID=4217 RepID=A0ACB9DJX5_ARCLA|nr:hypothetical protein L6452_09386 [Arctium lappa]